VPGVMSHSSSCSCSCSSSPSLENRGGLLGCRKDKASGGNFARTTRKTDEDEDDDDDEEEEDEHEHENQLGGRAGPARAGHQPINLKKDALLFSGSEPILGVPGDASHSSSPLMLVVVLLLVLVLVVVVVLA
jgi:hypothetical protein